jgi:hypothetical protein
MIDLSMPTSLPEAVQQLGAKTPVGSILRTAEWSQMPLALRQRAQFSAGVESARVLQRIQDYLMQMITLERNAMRADQSSPGIYTMNRQKFVADIQQLAIDEGLTPVDQADRGTLKDITSEVRLNLIFNTQIEQAHGYAFWKRGQDPDILNSWPAQELVRIEQRRVPRNWRARWEDAGGQLIEGRMVALKTDDIWTRISRFNTPFPPFDFNSGMGLEELDREEAISLGLLEDNQTLDPVDSDFNSNLDASVQDLSPDLTDALQTLFGDQISINDGTATWSGQ